MRKVQKTDSKVTRGKAEAATSFMKSLANPNRLMIACALLEGERSVGDLETSLGLRQPSLSQQLAELRENGIVEARREAKQVFYRIADARAVALLATLHQIFCGEMPHLGSATLAPPLPAPRKSVTYTTGDKSDLKPGTKIFIAAAKKLPDGSLDAARINYGKDGLTPPM
jgi:DNA-binding transcriptional ArsR family regulator